MKSIIVFSSSGFALINFRGSLIKLMLDQGCRVTCLAPDFSATQKSWLTDLGAVPVDISLKRTGLNPIAFLSEYMKLLAQVRSIRPDVLLTFFAKPNILGGLLAKRLGIKRFVPMVEGLGYTFGVEQPNSRRRIVRQLVVVLYRYAFKAASRVIFLNDNDKAEFEKLGICQPGRSTVLGPIGVPIKDFPEQRTYPDTITFVLCARMIVEKGVREFAEAARIIREKYPRSEFHLLGDVDDNPLSLSKDEINSWVHESVLKWHGHVDVVPYLYKASVFVLPTYYREGVPRSLQEAMAASLPVITTEIPGCTELVTHGENGILVKKRDVATLVAAMTGFLDNPERVSQMGRKSRTFAEQRLDSDQIDQCLFAHLLPD